VRPAVRHDQRPGLDEHTVIRQAKRLTQEDLAFSAEIDLTYMGSIERGKRNPSLMVMARIADALSVKLTDLLKQ
jgi:transcriptional regulator with XRE-family HTH domain